MTGGLLQLVATGIDSIFLTQNPSITLFKIVYKRYTNFSLTTRTKSIKNINDFDKEGYYILQKEADCINQIWLNFDISDLEIKYGTPTRDYINSLCAKYNFQITYQNDGSGNTIVTPEEYKYIINEINFFLKDEVSNYNNLLDIIKIENDYTTDTNIINQKSNIIATFKIKLNNLLTSYKNEVIDPSGNIYINKHTVNVIGQIIPNSSGLIYFKLLCFKIIFSTQSLISDTSTYTSLSSNSMNLNYNYLDNNYYDNPDYAIGFINGYSNGDKLNNTYTYTIRRLLESLTLQNNIKENININLDQYIRECVLLYNNQNPFLYNSTDNNLNNIKIYLEKIEAILNSALNILDIILTGYNPNGVQSNDYGGIYSCISLLTSVKNQIILLQNNLENQVYLKIQYKNLIDLEYYCLLYSFNNVYSQFYVNDLFIDVIYITRIKLLTVGFIIRDFVNFAQYINNLIFDTHENNTIYNSLSYHIESKYTYLVNNLSGSIITTDIQEQIDLEELLRSYMIDLINNKVIDFKNYNISLINDILYNLYLEELTYGIIGTVVYDTSYNMLYMSTYKPFYYYATNDLGLTFDKYIQNADGTYYRNLQYLYNSILLLHIIESNIPNNPNYVDGSGNYIGDFSDISKYYGYKMIDYFSEIIQTNNNPLIPILSLNNSYNNNPESAVLYTDLDTYKILQKFLTDSDIIYDNTSFKKEFIDKLTTTLKQNQYANTEILYNIILNSILTPAYHNNCTLLQYLQQGSYTSNNIYYNPTGDYYKFIFYKTFTNKISDTQKFSTLINSQIGGLSDNITSLFNKYLINKNLYTIYFAEDILNRINLMNYNIELYYETDFFIDYFNDINIWSKLLLNSRDTKNILQNLTIDTSGNIITLPYYYDASGFHVRPIYNNVSGTPYIPAADNIYDKFITPLPKLVLENVIFLNYTPLYLIRDVFDDIYNVITNYTSKNFDYYDPALGYAPIFSLNNFGKIQFDYRDLNEYDPTTLSSIPDPFISDAFIINNNIIFKNSLYRDVILNIILKINENMKIDYTQDFHTQIFTNNLFKVADFEYLTSFVNNFINLDRTVLCGLLRPESLIDIRQFLSEISVYTCFDSSGNVMYDGSGNPVQTDSSNNTTLYVPITRGIIEKIRIKLIFIIYYGQITVDSFVDQSGNHPDPGSFIFDFMKNDLLEYLFKTLDNYIKFDDVSNINNSIYSYNKYRNNGYIFSSTQQTNSTIFNNSIVPNFVQAPSSIWSYLNKMQIREYNRLFNEMLISHDYYINNLGIHMDRAYNEIIYKIKSSHNVNNPIIPYFYPTNFSQYNYSYNINVGDFSGNFNIYENYLTNNFYKTQNINNSTYPVSNYGIDYYALSGDYNIFIVSPYYIYFLQTYDYSEIFQPQHQTTTLMDWFATINSLLLSIDMRKSNSKINYDDEKYLYNFYLLGIGGYGQIDSYPGTNIGNVIPYYSNLLKIRNKKFDTNIQYSSLNDIIDYFNDYDTNTQTYKYYSDAESAIATRVKQKMLNTYPSYYDTLFTDFSGNYSDISGNDNILNYSVNSFVNLFQQSINPFTNNINYIRMQNVNASGTSTNIPPPYYIFQESITFFNKFVNYNTVRKNKMFNYFSEIINKILQNLNINIGETFFNGFVSKSDLIKFILLFIINDTNDLLNISSIKNIYSEDINNYDDLINSILLAQNTNNYNTIMNLTIPRSSSIIINYGDKITFSYDLQYIDLLYHIPDYYTQTDILYYGSELDNLLRNVIYQNPVKYCWVAELGYYLLEKCGFYLDELLVDEYSSELLSLLDKVEGIENFKRGLNIMIGNTEYYTTYDTNNKGNINIRIPLKFYFCKNIGLALPMINLLYTKGIIKFKTRKLEDLLIYDTNAIITKKPKLKCSTTIEYIYLEEEERLRISKSKLEFLIEKFRYGGKFKYDYNDIINNSISPNLIKTKLYFADPTKYILWRLKVIFPDKMKNNYTWNINGYLDDNYNLIKTTDYIKIYFNGSTREQGNSELFNVVNPHLRYTGSIDQDEYMYIFALYPLIHQPSGTANLTNIDDIIIEHQFTDNFINHLKTNGLKFEIEYWAYGYNVLRYISGMCAPIFYC
jgi:hypothetical protein